MSEAQDMDIELRHTLSRLPRSVEPTRDLWAGISAGMADEGGGSMRGGVSRNPSVPLRRGRSSWAWALAASVAGIGIGVALTLTVMRQQPVVSTPVQAGGAAYSFVPASTDGVRLRMQRDTYVQMAKLAPNTRAHVESDLNTITQALTDIQEALAQDPGNALLQDLLVSTYQDELSTLANVQALAGTAHTEVSL